MTSKRMTGKRSRPRAARSAAHPAGGSPASAPLTIVILAAGEGKRMKSALPKVLQPLAGRPLLRHVLDTARALAPAAIHVVYGHGGERVQAAFTGERVIWDLQAEQRGTGHALLQAMPHIPAGHMVLVLYGDVPLIGRATLAQLLVLAGAGRLALLSARLEKPEGYGRIVRDARGRVRRIIEQQDATRAELRIRECSTGVLAAPAELLKRWLGQLGTRNSQREYYLTDVVAMAVREGFPVHALLAGEPGEVLGVNDRAQLAELEGVWRARAAHALLEGGVTLADPARLDVRGTLTAASDVFIDANVVFEGRVSLGERVHIGTGCVIRDSEIAAGTRVLPHCVIEGALIGPDCVIGPFARLRPAAALARDVHIGNFVEVKNSRLDAGTKANHLAYVGDAQVGSRVNIGAGTIVANYDGAVKHTTTIGDDVHTGSNSVLVAPITVGAGATIAAGSTVTHTVPAGKLTVARVRQATVEGWHRPGKSRA